MRMEVRADVPALTMKMPRQVLAYSLLSTNILRCVDSDFEKESFVECDRTLLTMWRAVHVPGLVTPVAGSGLLSSGRDGTSEGALRLC